MAFKMDINWTEWFIMTKKIAVINDLSGFGKCSLTAAISVIASMGVQPCPLPTAILSAQTGFPSYFYDDYTDRMDAISAEWKKMNVRFDGIYTGFLSGRTQIGKVMSFLDTFYKDDTFLLVDPVMGDNGERFSIFSSEFQQEMKELTARADIVTPNLTELCLLTGEDSRLAADIASETDGRRADGRRNRRSRCHRHARDRQQDRGRKDGKPGSDERSGGILNVPACGRELFGNGRSVCIRSCRRKSPGRLSGGQCKTRRGDDRKSHRRFRTRERAKR